MGLAASQGRLLLLTAKKSDLEFRAQQISQSRLVLAQQQESVAKKYAEKTANTSFTFKDSKTDKDVPLTFKSFTTDAVLKEKYELRDKNGNQVNMGDKEAVKKAFGLDDEGYTKLMNDKGDADSIFKRLYDAGIIQVWEQGKKEIPEKTVDGVKQAKVEAVTAKQTSIAGSSDMAEGYDTTDDDNAKAEYDLAMVRIKNKDQRLELDLKGVETQHKAVETETESVGKIIQKNIEVSFKTFS